MSEMIFETWVKELADAIRTKKGTSDKIKALDYKQEILSIETGASGEPIIIETEEDFNALLENATQEDDGKIYLYNDNLYKLNYNETTTIRTLEIVANGEYDVALYDKVNVQVQSESSGATVETSGAIPIPNDGTFVENIMFNTSLSIDEVVSILSGITLNGDGMQEMIFVKSDGTIALGIMCQEGIWGIGDFSTFNFLFISSEGATDFVGWNPNFNGIIEVNGVGVNSFDGLPVGTQNEQLVNLCYVEGEPKSKTLSGTYDGSSIDVVENGVVDVETLIDEGKIPLKVNVDVESGASVEYLGGTALPTSGTISKIYFNVDRNPKDLLEIAKTLTYDYAVGSMGYAFPIVKSSSGDGLGILKLEKPEGTYYILARLSDVKMFWIAIGEEARWGDGTSNSMVSEFELNWEIVQGGTNNDLLKDFVSTTPFDQVSIKKISGTLDGMPITIVENAPIFMDNYIRENKLPMQINLDVKFGDFVPYDNEEIKNVFINTSLTNEEVDYELSKLNYTYYNIDFYNFVGSRNENGITIYQEDTTKHQIVFSKYNSNTSEYEKIIIYDTINGNGWVEETISTYFPNNVIELPITTPIGSQNDLIKKVISAVLEVDENGTYDTTKYGATIVNVASSGEDMLQSQLDLYGTIKLFGNSMFTSLEYAKNLDFSKTTSLYQLCYGNSSIKEIFYINTSHMTDFRESFYQCSKLETVPELDMMNATTIDSLFYMCYKLKNFRLINANNLQSCNSAFYYCESIEEISLQDTSKVTRMNSFFGRCKNLKTVELLDMRSVTSASSMFLNCTNLTNLTLKNIKVNLIIGSGTSYGHLLTLESLLNTCQECINVNASRTLTMGTANLEKLASVYVKLTNAPEEDATLPKLPMVQCESGDEGAMSVTDYMALKNWTLA